MMYDPRSWGPEQRDRLKWAPSVDEIIAMYEKSAGHPVADVAWDRALAGWRLGAITSLNVRLHRSGRRPDPVWEVMADSYPFRIGRALELARSSGTQRRKERPWISN
jgi:hypothetical protein